MPDSVILTLSFDDGLRTDIELAKLLESYGLRATFFLIVGKLGSSSTWLSKEDARWLSEFHEVASHTLQHPCLTRLTYEKLNRELKMSKLLLEKITGKDVVGFAYPYGIFNNHVKRCVKNAGYWYARSTNSYWIGALKDIKDLYSLSVTLPLYPVKLIGSIHDIIRKLRRAFLRVYVNLLLSDAIDFTLKKVVKRDYVNSIDLAKTIITMAFELSKVKRESYVISLWGHSWEMVLNKNLRSKFEDLLAFITSLGNRVRVMTLKELVAKYLMGING